MNQIIRRVSATAALTMSAAFFTSATAKADDHDRTGDGDAVRVVVPMTIGDIDEVQARRAGNKVVKRDGYKILIDGKTRRELARVPLPDTIVALDTVTGNCGSSYVEIRDKAGDRRVHFSTGFNLNGAKGGNAYDFDCTVVIEDAAGGYGGFTDSGPMWPSRVWDSGLVSRPIAGPGYAELTAEGTAYLTNGSVCFSGVPRDVERVS